MVLCLQTRSDLVRHDLIAPGIGKGNVFTIPISIISNLFSCIEWLNVIDRGEYLLVMKKLNEEEGFKEIWIDWKSQFRIDLTEQRNLEE